MLDAAPVVADWVRAQTGWQELFTNQAEQRWKELTGGAPATDTTGGWTSPESTFFASTLAEAKYRAWKLTSAEITATSEVGQSIADEFGVLTTMRWGPFFVDAQWDALWAVRATAARNMDKVVLKELNQTWLDAQAQGAVNDDAIGPAIARAWSLRPGFEWVKAETGWREFYTCQQEAQYQANRNTPIPAWVNAGGLIALLDRLRSADMDQVASYVIGIRGNAQQRDSFSQAISAEMGRLYPIANSSQNPAASLQAVQALLLCQTIYAQLWHLADYGQGSVKH